MLLLIAIRLAYLMRIFEISSRTTNEDTKIMMRVTKTNTEVKNKLEQ